MKTNWVHLLSGLWNLNKKLKRKPYPMPKISEMLLKLESCKYDTPLDLNMGYYHVNLREEDNKICIIILTWVKYRYKHL